MLTQEGWKLFKDVRPDDLYLTKDDEGNLLYLPAVKIVDKPFDDDLLLFENTEMSLLVTKNHNMWVFDYDKRSKKERTWKFMRADELTNGRYQFDVSGKWHGTVLEHIKIPPVAVSRGFYDKVYDGVCFDASLFMKFLGIWVTDGSISEAKGGGGRRIVITQTKKRGVKEIKKLLKALGLSYKRYGDHFRIRCLPLWFKLKEWFIRDENYRKSLYVRVPSWIKGLETNLLNQFVEGMFLGDGSVDKTRSLIYSSSLGMCEDLVEVALKTNRCASIREYRPDGHKRHWKDGSVSVCKPCYVVNMKSKKKIHLGKRRKENTIGEKVPCKGRVYCVELPMYHRLFVMRKGRAVWCGNTHELVRHRLCAYSQESTRYCNYGGKGIIGIDPGDCGPLESQESYERLLAFAEQEYDKQVEQGVAPQWARRVLPIGLKTEIVFTANFRQLRHMMGLRLGNKAGKAHPQIRALFRMILDALLDTEAKIIFEEFDVEE